MKLIRPALTALAALAVIAAAAPGARAQSRGLGTLNGVITSEQGQPVESASVKVYLSGGDAIETKTNDSGKWNLIGVGKGEFQVEFIKDGFATKRVKVVVDKEAMRTEPIKTAMKKG